MEKKKIITITIIIILLISAISYHLLYKKFQKNQIIQELNEVDSNIDVSRALEIEEARIFVDVGGEVNTPGLYELKDKARVNDAIVAAGGVTEGADMELVNLAYILSDEMKITIPSKKVEKENVMSGETKPLISSKLIVTMNDSKVEQNGKVNINTANKGELETLKGIGSAMAERIIEYRQNQGDFNTIDEIKNVSGIGEAKFSSIKNQITV